MAGEGIAPALLERATPPPPVVLPPSLPPPPPPVSLPLPLLPPPIATAGHGASYEHCCTSIVGLRGGLPLMGGKSTTAVGLSGVPRRITPGVVGICASWLSFESVVSPGPAGSAARPAKGGAAASIRPADRACRGEEAGEGQSASAACIAEHRYHPLAPDADHPPVTLCDRSEGPPCAAASSRRADRELAAACCVQ